MIVLFQKKWEELVKGTLENSAEEGTDIPLTIDLAIPSVTYGGQYLTTGIN